MARFDLDSMDLRVKRWLLAVSAATLVLLVAAALRENVFTQWRFVRKEYAKILQKKASDERGKAAAAAFEVRIEQNVLPALGVVDRCITCHAGIEDPRMAGEKKPFRTHPGELLKQHPPEKFGCTVCHRGQGRALVFEEAKAEGHHWDYPFLPKDYFTAECGRCHTQLPHPTPSVAREGERLFRTEGCVQCHRLDGVGSGTGPDLSTRGLRLLGRNWWAGHPAYGATPGRSALGDLKVEDRDTLQAYLVTRHGASRLAQGQTLYTWFGCGGCHKIRSQGGTLGPDLSNVGRKIAQEFIFKGVEGKHDVPTWLYEHFLDPERISPGSKMPRLEMSRDAAKALTTYMLSLRQELELPQAYVPADARVAPEAPRGDLLFARHCSTCHGTNGEGKARTSLGRSVPGLLNADFLRIAQPDTLREVARKGRPDRDMPTWRDALDQPSLEAVLAFVEGHRARPKSAERILALPGSADRGRQVFTRNCAVCHGPSGEGAIGPKLRSGAFLGIASDRFLLETLNQGRPHTPMPAWADLSGEDQAGLLSLFRAWRQETGGFKATAPIALGQAFQGEPVYAANCVRCHGERGEGGPAVALHNPVLLASASPEYLAGSLLRCRTDALRGDRPALRASASPQAPAARAGNPHSQPDLNGTKARPAGPPELPAQKLGELVAFLQSWRGDPRPVPTPKYRPLAGDPAKGASLFKGQCAGCHGERGVNGLAPAIGSPRLLELVSDGYLAATIALGRAGTVMTARGTNAPGNAKPLAPKEILDVVAYLRSLAPKEASR